MAVSAADVKRLREMTGAGMMDCKKALVEANGNLEEAETILRKKGVASAAKKAGRIAAEGLIESYIHLGGKVGVLVEFAFEKAETFHDGKFKELAMDICLHVAAANPLALNRDGIPAQIVEDEKALFAKQVEGKPANIVEGILTGKLNKFYATHTLLEQAFVKDDKISITQLLAAKGKEIGDNITIKRYTRWALGEA